MTGLNVDLIHKRKLSVLDNKFNLPVSQFLIFDFLDLQYWANRLSRVSVLPSRKLGYRGLLDGLGELVYIQPLHLIG